MASTLGANLGRNLRLPVLRRTTERKVLLLPRYVPRLDTGALVARTSYPPCSQRDSLRLTRYRRFRSLRHRPALQARSRPAMFTMNQGCMGVPIVTLGSYGQCIRVSVIRAGQPIRVVRIQTCVNHIPIICICTLYNNRSESAFLYQLYGT